MYRPRPPAEHVGSTHSQKRCEPRASDASTCRRISVASHQLALINVPQTVQKQVVQHLAVPCKDLDVPLATDMAS